MKRILTIVLLVGVLLAAVAAYLGYKAVYSPNIELNKEKAYLYIPTGATYADVKQALTENGWLKNSKSFDLLAQQMNYPAHVYAGCYLVENKMSNRELILILRAGEQVTLKLTLNKVRRLEEIANQVAEKFELKKDSLMEIFKDPAQIPELEGFNKHNIMCLFLPDTYKFYWNTDAEAFVKRMKREYERYWNDERKRKAKAKDLNPEEVIILASIVEEESYIEEERPIIAGLYLNRLDKKMRLQADPTVRYALGDFEIQRILNKHLEKDSPYNTYLYYGLPPGPICTPSKNSIEAVLNAKDHNYLYMCAKADFSGRHAFSTTLREHMNNARAFQRALNERKIYR